MACICLGLIGFLNADSSFNKAYISKVADDAVRVQQLIDLKHPGDWHLENGKLYKGKELMEGINSELDELAGDDVITIFSGNTRVSTTVTQNGQRAVGTQANADIYEQVVGHGETANVQADVVGVPYYTCYMPITGSNGDRVGMLFVGAPSAPVIASERYNSQNVKMLPSMTGAFFYNLFYYLLKMFFRACLLTSLFNCAK